MEQKVHFFFSTFGQLLFVAEIRGLTLIFFFHAHAFNIIQRQLAVWRAIWKCSCCWMEIQLEACNFVKKRLDLKACNFIEKWLQHNTFPVNIAKFFRTPILKNICNRLLLAIYLPFVRKKMLLLRYWNERYPNHKINL